MRFETEYIDELLAKADLTEIMRLHGVQVRLGAGQNNFYVADFCCGKKDFDNGRIKKETQTFLCEACKTGGNAIHFLRNVEGYSFYKAVEYIAEFTNTPLPEPKKESAESKRKQEALKLAVSFFQEQNNFDYFLSRGISKEVLEKHKAGYAPGGRELRSYLMGKGFSKEELIQFKLIHPKNGLDTMYYRAIVPIIQDGKIIDIYGRATRDDKAGVKHFYLYGNVPFLGGYDHLEPNKMVTVFESYIDQLVAETHGYTNGTNAGGASKFASEHVRLLKRKNPERTVFVYDGDKAGREGALAAADLLSKEKVETFIGYLPEGEDPAEILSQEGQMAFKEKVDIWTYEKAKMYALLDQYSIADIEAYLNDVRSGRGM
ncbi:toprim domain-containing protein [Paenibacillus hubeiensis]|uniref:toprim domain-containing protein n=1 Tax=Paenibacillus hubeiensis TaxID=3077330 RepID=UPI0031BAB311